MANLPVPVPRTFQPSEVEAAAYLNSVRDNLTFLANKPIARLRQATVQAMAAATWVPMNFDNTDVDSYGGHSNTTNNSRYTAVVAGWYWCFGTTGVNGNSTRIDVIVAKNGAFVAGAQFVASAAVVGGGDNGALVFLNAGDYVELWGRQNSGGALNTNVATDLCPTFNISWDHA